MFSSFRKWVRKLAVFFARRNVDFIGSIDDMQYYRIVNKDKGPITLKVKETHKHYGLPDEFSIQSKDVEIFSGRALNAIGKEEILKQVYDENISFQPLGIEFDTDYRISNRTARRIGIKNYDTDYGELVIPPFGTRTVNSELLKWYKFLEWQRQDLIRIEREDQAYNGPAGLSRLWDWVKLLPGVLLVGLAGFGIPLWIVYYFGGGSDLLRAFITGTMFSGQDNTALIGLGRLFQLAFICIASILPALFYYLFGRQQVEKLREKFFHDILVLDPHLYTLSEAEAKYDTLLSSAFGSGSSNSPFAILLLIFSTALLVTGWTIALTPYGPIPESANRLVDFFRIDPSPLSIGFLGVYFFSINMIFRRYVRADLTPKTYAYITVRLLVSLVLVYSISVLPEFSNSSFVQEGLLPIAFIIGVFPDEGFRIIRDSARKVIPGLRGGGDEKYPLTDLEGMNQYDQARLLEEGIENIENLAHHNLIELLALTRIPTARLVDMFDQAILYLHLGIFEQSKPEDKRANGEQVSDQPKPQDDMHNSGRELLQYLKSFGVRTATDLDEILKDENARKTIETDARFNQLKSVRTTFKDDEWLSYIMNWRKESSKDAAIKPYFVDDPYSFYETQPENGSQKNSRADTNGNSSKGSETSTKTKKRR